MHTVATIISNSVNPFELGVAEEDEWPYRLASSVLLYSTINMDYTHEQPSVHLVAYHFVWCPKRRRKLLIGPIHDRLKTIMEQVAEEHAWKILRLAIQPDHVQLFIHSNPYTLPSDIPRLMKGRSSHDLREEFPHLKKMPLCKIVPGEEEGMPWKMEPCRSTSTPHLTICLSR